MVFQGMTCQFDLDNEPMRQALMNKRQIRNASLTLENESSGEYTATIFRHQTRQSFNDLSLEVTFYICRWVNKLKNIVWMTLAG